MFQCDDCTKLYQDGANVASGGPTDWHSAGRERAAQNDFKKPRSRARSGRLHCRVGRGALGGYRVPIGEKELLYGTEPPSRLVAQRGGRTAGEAFLAERCVRPRRCAFGMPNCFVGWQHGSVARRRATTSGWVGSTILARGALRDHPGSFARRLPDDLGSAFQTRPAV
jgi:hypothetical protein